MISRWIFLILLVGPVLSTPELKLLHVVFSHKLYAPIQRDLDDNVKLPDKLDYQHFLETADDMSNAAKMNLFNLGVELKRSYGEFLGDIYHPNIMEVRTSEYVLSMISAQLVNAGLWPPTDIQKWNDELDWQPIASDYVPVEEDTLLLGSLCPIFEEEDKIINNKWESKINMHKSLFNYVSINYGKKVERPSDLALIYSTLETINDNNAMIPSWANDIFPVGQLLNVTLLSYELEAQSKIKKILNGGTLLKKIIEDSMNFKNSENSKRKLYLYSGEEKNIHGILQSLDVWVPHVLSPGAALVFEIYSDSFTKEFTVKINYRHSVEGTVIPLKLPNCEEYCGLSQLSTILQDILPDDVMTLCHQKTNKIGNNSSTSILSTSIIVSLIIFNFIINLIN